MFINKSEFRYWSMTAILFAFMATKCLAEDFPTKPITLVVSYTIGGQSDTLARLLAKQMEEDRLSLPNGIACSLCLTEMIDDNRRYTLEGLPPRYACHCPACGHSTERLI